jgi:hypothetical protein
MILYEPTPLYAGKTQQCLGLLKTGGFKEIRRPQAASRKPQATLFPLIIVDCTPNFSRFGGRRTSRPYKLSADLITRTIGSALAHAKESF